MEWFIAVVAVLALGVAAVVAAGGGGQMAKDPVHDTYAARLPDEPITGADLRTLRFGVGLRGYAMDQVDALLDRLAAEIDVRDARIAELSDAGPPGSEQDVPVGPRPAASAPPAVYADPERT